MILVLAALSLFSVMPGTGRDTIVSSLEKSALAFRDDGKCIVVDEPLVEAIFERQQTVFHFEGNRLVATRVIVTPDRGATPNDVLRLYEEVKRLTIRELGRPAWERREGSVRIAEWEPRGRIVRVGVPRRIDGTLLPEIIITRDPLPRNAEVSLSCR